MTEIVKASANDAQLLADIGKQTFIESHGRSAAKTDIDFYINENCSYNFFQNELRDPRNIYHIIYHDKLPAGYSKIILDYTHTNIEIQNVTKLERIYLLKEFYELKLGFELFNFNMKLSKSNNQAGMWLFVWTENARAISFYEKNGFKTIGSYVYKISETHSNPNYQMLLEY